MSWRRVLDERRPAVVVAAAADHPGAARRQLDRRRRLGEIPTGFSQAMCLPAAAAASTSSRWSAFGAVMSTTSTAGSSITRASRALARAKPKALRRLVEARRDGVGAVRRAPGRSAVLECVRMR